jgi:hypothetical protein
MQITSRSLRVEQPPSAAAHPADPEACCCVNDGRLVPHCRQQHTVCPHINKVKLLIPPVIGLDVRETPAGSNSIIISLLKEPPLFCLAYCRSLWCVSAPRPTAEHTRHTNSSFNTRLAAFTPLPTVGSPAPTPCTNPHTPWAVVVVDCGAPHHLLTVPVRTTPRPHGSWAGAGAGAHTAQQAAAGSRHAHRATTDGYRQRGQEQTEADSADSNRQRRQQQRRSQQTHMQLSDSTQPELVWTVPWSPMLLLLAYKKVATVATSGDVL